MSEEFYAVVFTTHVHHEADQRSIDHPGHGYPAWTEDIPAIKRFDNKEELQKWVEREEKGYSPKKYEVIACRPISVTTTVSIGD